MSRDQCETCAQVGGDCDGGCAPREERYGSQGNEI